MAEQTTSPKPRAAKRTLSQITVTLRANPVLLSVWVLLLLWILASVVMTFIDLGALIQAERDAGTDAQVIIGGVVLSVSIMLVLTGAAFLGVLFLKRWARILFGAYVIIAIVIFNIGSIIAGIVQLAFYLYLYGGYEKALARPPIQKKEPVLAPASREKGPVQKRAGKPKKR
ncbi:MAG: hypothetical protein WC505_00130 [Patescibacteria group bacterium]